MTLQDLTTAFLKEEEQLKKGGPKERQEKLHRLTARERLAILLDDPQEFFEVGLWAAYGMYAEHGSLPAAGVVTGIGKVMGRSCMIIANDATVKAGAFFPQSVKKVLRAQRMAYECRLPILYLVDSSGVFLPMQDEIFPDEDDFGRIFRNNAVLSAQGIPQYAAIMGNCIAGGGYLPVLCDQLLMTEGSGLYLAGPALVKAAIGQVVDTETLGGAKMHASLSGTVDYLEKDDASCLMRLRQLVSMLPPEESVKQSKQSLPQLYDFVSPEGNKTYDMRKLIEIIVDKGSFIEYKAEYGQALVCGFATLGQQPIGIVANQRMPLSTGKGEVEIGGVIYADSADKAARFILECNQIGTPLLFLQDVMGFMVGKAAEASGIIKSGAKMVNAISNSIVPKITIILGNSFGAGHYALCGKAYDPTFILAWPSAKYAVMGAEQARETLQAVQTKAAEKGGKAVDHDTLQEMQEGYARQMDIRYGAARGWIDAIIDPSKTRSILRQLLPLAMRSKKREQSFHTGVIQL